MVAMVSWFLLLLFAFALFCFVALGTVLAIVSHRTRPLGLGILGIASFVFLGGGALVFLATMQFSRGRAEVRSEATIQEAVAELRIRERTDESIPVQLPDESEFDTTIPVALAPPPVPATETPEAEAPCNRRGRQILRSMGRAMAAAAENRNDEAAPQPDLASEENPDRKAAVDEPAHEEPTADGDETPASVDETPPTEVTTADDETETADETASTAADLPVPTWVEQPMVQDDLVTVSSGLKDSRTECRQALLAAMKVATDQKVAELLGDPEAARHVDFSVAYIERELLREPVYEEKKERSFGPQSKDRAVIYEQYALLEFTPAFRTEVQRRWGIASAKIKSQLEQCRIASRSSLAGLGLVTILAMLATVFAYLKMETSTGGRYTGRLQFAAGAAILAWVALGMLAARHIPWM